MYRLVCLPWKALSVFVFGRDMALHGLLYLFHPIILDRDRVLPRITLFSVPLRLTVGSRC